MKNELLREGERLDDLGRNHLEVIQKKDGYCFAMDSVLLADFAYAEAGERVLDLCTGSGVVMLLMQARYPGALYMGLELQEALWDRACRSIRHNRLEDELSCLKGDIRAIKDLVPESSADAVTANPPYRKAGQGKVSPNPEKALARHEISCSLQDVLAAAVYALRTGGRFYLVHLAERKDEILKEALRVGLFPVRLREVAAHEGEKPKLLLLECVKKSSAEAKPLYITENPLIVYHADETYTDEIMEIYGHGR